MGAWKGSRFKSESFEREAAKCIRVKVENECYRDQNYTIHLYQGNEITQTGLLLVAELEPNKSSLPRFQFRWDEKDDKLDVDILGVSDIVKGYFKRGEKGYEGHRPKRISSEKRTFAVNILTPQIHVFHGCLSFNLYRKAGVGKGTVNSVGTTSPKPI